MKIRKKKQTKHLALKMGNTGLPLKNRMEKSCNKRKSICCSLLLKDKVSSLTQFIRPLKGMSTWVTGDRQAPLLPLQAGQTGQIKCCRSTSTAPSELRRLSIPSVRRSSALFPQAHGSLPVPCRDLVRPWVTPRNPSNSKPGQEHQQEQICVWPGVMVPSQAGGRECAGAHI